MTRAEEIARMNAAELRKPKVDVFAQSAKDQREAELPKIEPKPIKKPFRSNGILRVDMALEKAGAN